MHDIYAKIVLPQNSNGNYFFANNGEPQCKEENESTSSNEKIEVKFPDWFGILSIVFMLLIITGIICSVIFIKNICEPFNDPSTPVVCIQYTVSLALILAAVIIAAFSLIKQSKWLIKVDLIKQLLNTSCSVNDRELIKKFCDTLAEL